MSLSGWLIAGTIFVLILVIALGIGWWLRNNRTPEAAPLNKYTAPLGWGQPTAGPNPAKNFCQLYQFPTEMVDIGTPPVETAVPGNPTFNSEILDNLQGTKTTPSCLDPDQILAQQQQHTCIAPEGVIDGQITRCFLISGGTTGLGGTETYYTNVGCAAIPACVGELSLVSINFQAPSAPEIYCLQAPGVSGGSITMEECNPSISQQLFRVTRTNPGQNPNTLSQAQGQNGMLAQILDRDTGLCVVPGTESYSSLYDPNFLGNPSCTGSNVEVMGTNVVLGECTGGEFPGYVWAFVPSLPYCSIIGGCSGCTGCAGCAPEQGSNFCSGCAGCTGYHDIITPPQIVYVGNLDVSQAPTGTTGYNGLFGPSALFQWLLDNNAQSLYYGGGDNNLVLTAMGVDHTICLEKAYTAQYMNITSYNTISEESVCLADQTLGTQYCTGL